MHNLMSRAGARVFALANTLNPTSRGRHLVTQTAQTLGLLPRNGFHQVLGLTMNLRMTDYIDRSIYFDSYEFLVRKVICRNLDPGDTFVDVGANIGYYTLLAARRVGETGKVFAVEASPEVLLRLRENIEANKLTNVSIVPYAVGERDGECEIYIPESQTHGVASLRDQGYGPTHVAKIEMRCLDDLLDQASRIDFVKIDIEGAELGALKGMARIITNHRPLILVEIVPKFLQNFGHSSVELVDFVLRANPGYRVWHVQEHKIVEYPSQTLRGLGDRIWGNFVFSEARPHF